MAEAVGLSSAVLTLATAAYKSCQALHNGIDGFRSANEQMLALSSDLENFYLVLGSLQTVLQDEESAPVAVDRIMASDLSKALDGSMRIFKNLSTIVASLRRPSSSTSPGNLNKAKWALKEKSIADLRNELMQCKITLNIAICVANQYNLRSAMAATSAIRSDVQTIEAATVRLERDTLNHLQEFQSELRSKLPRIIQQQENILALELLKPSRHTEEDRANVRTDMEYTVRHFVDSTASTKSISTPFTPSFRVSTFDAATSTQSSSFCSALEYQDLPISKDWVYGHIQIFVRNAGTAKTLIFQLDSEITIEQLQQQIRDRIELPSAQFVLLHAGKLLHQTDISLRNCGVTHDATFTCVSFVPRPKPPKIDPRTIMVTVQNLQGKVVVRDWFNPQFSIWLLKRFYAYREGKGRVAEEEDQVVDPQDPHDIDIVYKGYALADDTCISDMYLTTEFMGQVVNRGDYIFHALTSSNIAAPAAESLPYEDNRKWRWYEETRSWKKASLVHHVTQQKAVSRKYGCAMLTFLAEAKQRCT